MRILFYGSNAAYFRERFEAACEVPCTTAAIGDADRSPAALAEVAAAEVIIGAHWRDPLLVAPNLRLFHVAGAGYDAIDRTLLPAGASLCNCFGHEPPIAEYVMAAALLHAHPLTQADRGLREGSWRWSYAGGARPRDELGGRTIGLLGYGHIGREVARKAKAFDLEVVACNRGPVATGGPVDAYVPLAERQRFYARVDIVVVSLPHLPETTGIVDRAAFAAMRPHAYVINVGRGPVIDERALYEALKDRRIGGAAIDTWYVYPTPEQPMTLPSILPFHELDNVVMTPHLSGWTTGTVRRRAEVMAENVGRLAQGRELVNLVA